MEIKRVQTREDPEREFPEEMQIIYNFLMDFRLWKNKLGKDEQALYLPMKRDQKHLLQKEWPCDRCRGRGVRPEHAEEPQRKVREQAPLVRSGWRPPGAEARRVTEWKWEQETLYWSPGRASILFY